jgi:hypothetical protein
MSVAGVPVQRFAAFYVAMVGFSPPYEIDYEIDDRIGLIGNRGVG